MTEATKTAVVAKGELDEETYNSRSVDAVALISEFAGFETTVFSTAGAATFDEKIAMTAAADQAKPLEDNIGVEIDLVHIVLQKAEFLNEETSEITEGVRLVLVDENGDTYSTASQPLFKTVRSLIGNVGMPDTWEHPIRVKVIEKKSRNKRNFFAFEYLPFVAAAA